MIASSRKNHLWILIASVVILFWGALPTWAGYQCWLPDFVALFAVYRLMPQHFRDSYWAPGSFGLPHVGQGLGRLQGTRLSLPGRYAKTDTNSVATYSCRPERSVNKLSCAWATDQCPATQEK